MPFFKAHPKDKHEIMKNMGTDYTNSKTRKHNPQTQQLMCLINSDTLINLVELGPH